MRELALVLLSCDANAYYACVHATILNQPSYLMPSAVIARAGELVNVLREGGAPVPPELLKFGTHVKKKEHSLYGAHFKAGGGGGDDKPMAAPTKMKFDDDE